MIEILVSIFVLAIGIIGAIKMQITALQATQQQVYYSSAMLLVGEMADKMRENPEQFHSGVSPFLKVDFQAAMEPPPTSRGCFNSDCSPDQLAAADIAEWLENITNRLPNVRAVICQDDEPWNEQSQSFSWECKSSGNKSSVVIKLGWADKTNQSNVAAPRIAIPVAPFSI